MLIRKVTPLTDDRQGFWALRMARLRGVLVHRVLGVEDTPHRIAWGFAIGIFVAFTPTLGLQIMLYLALSTALRANKVSGIPVLFISNPLSAVPLYWFCWRVGAFILGAGDGEGPTALLAALEDSENAPPLSEVILTEAFWSDAWAAMKSMGAELWLGSCVLGLLFAVPGYFLVRRGVGAFREQRAKRKAAPS